MELAYEQGHHNLECCVDLSRRQCRRSLFSRVKSLERVIEGATEGSYEQSI